MLDHPRHTCVFRGEEITVSFRGRSVRSDYGVPGSPVWFEIEDIEIDQLEILGVTVDPKVLPQKLQQELLDLNQGLEWSID